MSSLQMNQCFKAIYITPSEGLASETRIILFPVYIDRCVKDSTGNHGVGAIS